MVAAGGHGHASSPSLGSLEALREVKRTEQKVADLRAAADKEAEKAIQDARADARSLVEDAIEQATHEAETKVQQAVDLARGEADTILAKAKREAASLRDVSDTVIDKAAEDVLQRLRDRIGGA